jgi:tetratricopeptide (TPR) repeat protein
VAYINPSGGYRAKGDFDQAIADLDKALALDPSRLSHLPSARRSTMQRAISTVR